MECLLETRAEAERTRCPRLPSRGVRAPDPALAESPKNQYSLVIARRQDPVKNSDGSSQETYLAIQDSHAPSAPGAEDGQDHLLPTVWLTDVATPRLFNVRILPGS